MEHETPPQTNSGSLAPMLVILAGVAAVFAVLLLAVGDTTFLPATGVLFGLIVLFTLFESGLARHQARSTKSDTPGDGPLPVMGIKITDPFNMDGDLPHEVGLHDFPPGHPARWTMRHGASGADGS
jgi:hypothetical protein